ncbi:hypothetical protein BaRGS_00003446, partial [Batillaria attramentaria]
MASSASLSAASAAKVRCVIHFSATNEDEAICALTETTFDRILDFSNKWKRLVGAQGDVARVFVATSAESCSSLHEASDAGVGFHRQCYNRFTDSAR